MRELPTELLLVAERGLSSRSPRLQELGYMGLAAAAPGLSSTGSIASGLSCLTACGSSWIRIEVVSPALAGRFFPPSHQGSPPKRDFLN